MEEEGSVRGVAERRWHARPGLAAVMRRRYGAAMNSTTTTTPARRARTPARCPTS